MKHETLNNMYAKKPCAYCRLKDCSLTVKQVKAKECLKKQCWYLVKYDHEWWKQREAIKKKKKEHKKAGTILNYSV